MGERGRVFGYSFFVYEQNKGVIGDLFVRDGGRTPDRHEVEERLLTHVWGHRGSGDRQLLKQLVGLPVLGAFGFSLHEKRQFDSLEEKYLLQAGADGLTSATLKTFSFSKLSDLKGTMTCGRIGNLQISRMILGGNLMRLLRA